MKESQTEFAMIQRELFKLNQKIKENNWRFYLFLRFEIFLLAVVIWSIVNPVEKTRLAVITDLAFVLLVFVTGYLYLLGNRVKLDLTKSKYFETSLAKLIQTDRKQLGRCNFSFLNQVMGSVDSEDEERGAKWNLTH